MNVLWRRGRLPSYIYGVISKDIKNAQCIYVNSLCCTTSGTISKAVRPILKQSNLCFIGIRCKSKTHVGKDVDNEDSDVLDDDISLTKDSKIMKLNTTSLRTDAILKTSLGVARNKIEKLFYESKIRVNGKKILKKSKTVEVDYEIDVIKSVSPKNPDHLLVSRVEILNIAATENTIVITVRRFKNLLIENYESDPYKPSTADED